MKINLMVIVKTHDDEEDDNDDDGNNDENDNDRQRDAYCTIYSMFSVYCTHLYYVYYVIRIPYRIYKIHYTVVYSVYVYTNDNSFYCLALVCKCHLHSRTPNLYVARTWRLLSCSRVARLFTFHKFWTSVELLCFPMWSKKIVIKIFFDLGPKRSLCVALKFKFSQTNNGLENQ